jgi:hypothetical protein
MVYTAVGCPPILVRSPPCLFILGGCPTPTVGCPTSTVGCPTIYFPPVGHPPRLFSLHGCPIIYTVGHPTLFVNARAAPPILFPSCGPPPTHFTPHWWAAPQLSRGAAHSFISARWAPPLNYSFFNLIASLHLHTAARSLTIPQFIISFFGRDGLLSVVVKFVHSAHKRNIFIRTYLHTVPTYISTVLPDSSISLIRREADHG